MDSETEGQKSSRSTLVTSNTIRELRAAYDTMKNAIDKNKRRVTKEENDKRKKALMALDEKINEMAMKLNGK